MAPKKTVDTQQTTKAPPSKQQLIKDAMAKINGKLGVGTVGTLASKVNELTIKYIPTRSPNVNAMLNGGIGCGKIVEIYGSSDSGKTSLLLDTIGYNMQLDPNFYCAFYETEGHLDFDYATSTFGIDPERLSIWHMDDHGAENGLDVLESLLRSGAYNMFVVNTVSGLTPKTELDSSMEDQSMALQARMMSKLMRKITAIAARNNTTVVFINQVRDTMQMKANPVPSGGKALSYWASQRINMRGGYIEADDKAKGYDPEFHKKIDCKVTKNRLCTKSNPYKKCTYYVEYGVGIDMIGEIPQLAVDAGILIKSGSWFYYGSDKDHIDTTTSPGKWNGIGLLRSYLRDNEDFAQELRIKIESAGIQTLTVQAMDAQEVADAKETEQAIINAISTVEEDTDT
jgi:recombination protein RecA